MQPWEQREADRQLLELSTTQTLATNSRPEGGFRNEQRFVREIVEMLVFIVVLFFLVRGVMQNFLIEGMSMEPTLHDGQFILVNKLAYLHFDLQAPQRLLESDDTRVPADVVFPFGLPKYGDIMVFEYPNDISKDYIKRVIGLPGDQVAIRDGVVFVNGRQLAEPYLDGAPTYCQFNELCNAGAVVVPPEHVFVMGDNRENSSDSREWGMLPFDRIIGKAWFVYWPSESMGPIEHFDPMMFQ
jgi:signal peptidase I